MEWLKAPYYTPEPEVRVPCGPFFGSQPVAESLMQVLTSEALGWPSGFMFGGAGEGASTPIQVEEQFVAYAKGLANTPFAKYTALDFDPEARGKFYANLVIETLKRIPAAIWSWRETGSVYDVWVRGK